MKSGGRVTGKTGSRGGRKKDSLRSRKSAANIILGHILEKHSKEWERFITKEA